MNTFIYLAPLQSFTTIPYCLVFNQVVGGIKKYFTPFYKVQNHGSFLFEKELYYRKHLNLIPQIVTNSYNDLIYFGQEMVNRGFKEINLNLGCPFPMLVKRKLGSGLLPYPELLETMLSEYLKSDLPVKLSVKLRLGLSDADEVVRVLDVLKNFPIEEIILHPRLGVQKYNGEPDWDKFSELNQQYNLVGNGDILSEQKLNYLSSRFSNVEAWMIGRGLLINPCMLRADLNWKDTILKLHDLFLEIITDLGLSNHQILNQLKCFWLYPSQYVEGGQRVYRKLKKVGSILVYRELVNKLLDLYEDVN